MSGSTEHRKKVKLRNDPGDAHFSTFSCYQRLPLLSKDRSRLWLIDALIAARIKHHFDLWAWVIMPEHVHLLLYPRPVEYEMSDILHDIKQPVAKRAIRYLRKRAPHYLDRLTTMTSHGPVRHFWQCGPGYDENVNEPKAIHEIIDYIHQNPVRRGLVAKAEDWPWSSARDWAGLESPWIQVDRTVPTLHIVGE